MVNEPETRFFPLITLQDNQSTEQNLVNGVFDDLLKPKMNKDDKEGVEMPNSYQGIWDILNAQFEKYFTADKISSYFMLLKQKQTVTDFILGVVDKENRFLRSSEVLENKGSFTMNTNKESEKSKVLNMTMSYSPNSFMVQLGEENFSSLIRK